MEKVYTEDDLYRVILTYGDMTIRTNVWAKSIDEATDMGYAFGEQMTGYKPRDWDEIEVMYIGEEAE